MRECPHCGTEVAAESRFCPECGRSLDGEEGATAIRARRRWPPDPVMIVVALVVVGAVILLAGGVWAWGLVALLAAGILFLSQREAERQAARYALAGFRERFLATRAAFAARSRGHVELFRARRERAELEAERNGAFHQLGQAVFYGDKAGTKSAKAAVQEVADRIETKEAEIEALIRQTDERVQRAQAGVRPTEKIEAEQPPEPVRIPEPWPPPDEGTPPTPEPVPEPSPDDPAPEPEHPPMPQTSKAKRGR
jgi:outer membrane biosynthesis protein TonB